MQILQESNYRIKCLKEKEDKYKGRKIALYGTGDNAGLIIRELQDNVLCLIDKNRTGEYVYDRKVIAIEDAPILGIEVIIIAAITASSIRVEDRIWRFCFKNHIQLLDMYGSDLIDRRRAILEQEMNYQDLDEKKMIDNIKSFDSIYVEYEGCLFDEYNNGTIYRKEVFGLLHKAHDLGKRIYVIRGHQNRNDIMGAFARHGIESPFLVIPKDDTKNLSDGAFREVIENPQNSLFLGTRYDEAMALAYAYGIKVQLLKSVWTMIKEVSGVHLDRNLIVDKCSGEMIGDITSRLTSPFSSDIMDMRSRYRNNGVVSGRKIVLVVTYLIPRFDCDSGSKTIYQYIKLFIERGYHVVILPTDFARSKYADIFESMGVEILAGEKYRIGHREWILEHAPEIAFSFVCYPEVAIRMIDLLTFCGIKTMYYGLDLHYHRKEREFKITGEERYKDEAEFYREIEEKVISKTDAAFYPSDEEVDIVRDVFGIKAHYLTVLFYNEKYKGTYSPKKREGLMYVGGFRHIPNLDAVKWFLTEIYPTIWKSLSVPFFIIGADEPDELKAINMPGVVHVGYVSDDELYRYYERVRMVVIPIRYGAGVKGKVVETMHMGVPMVSTTIGIEGIPEAEQIIEYADDPSDFAQKVILLYQDEERLKLTSKKYIEHSCKYYSADEAWTNFAAVLEEV